MKIYVGNLPFEAREDELRELFAPFGTVAAATVIVDPRRDRSRGFGFVDMNDQGQASAAVSALHGAELGGRTLVVNEAKPRGGDGYGERRSHRQVSERSSRGSGGYIPRH
jgi:cold-inducible RNA-binding protein